MRSQGRYWQRQGLKEDLASEWNIAQVNRFWQVIGVRLQKVPTPKIRTRLHVTTDGFTHRIVCLTREACIFVLQLLYYCRTKREQVERQVIVVEVQVADEPVVVIKSEPVKP